MSEPVKSRGRRILRRLSAVLIGFVAFALLLEIGLRVFTDKGHTLFYKDALTGRRYQPGFAGWRYVDEAQRDVYLRFHRDGYRGPDRPYEKPPGKRRVVVLGDSFTIGTGVAEEDTMVARLEELLGPGWEAMNFGVSGYSTAQSLLTWRHFAKRYEPDLVLLDFANMNDLTDNCRRLTKAPRPYFDVDDAGRLTLTPVSPARAGLGRLLDHSRLYVWQKELFSRLRHGFRQATKALPKGLVIMDTRPTPDVAYAWKITEAVIRKLESEVEAAGIPFVLVIAPAPDQYDGTRIEELADRPEDYDRGYPERRLAAFVKRCIPLVAAFRAARKSGELNFSMGHWNDRGHEVAAQEVHRRLVAMGLVD